MKLLYAIDLRANDLWRLDEVGDWAHRLGATVDFLYVDPFGDYAPYVLDPQLGMRLKHELEVVRGRDKEALDEAMSQLPEDARGEVQTRSGDPAQAVCDAAQAYDALLVSTRGRTGAVRLWLGSVAERIVRTHHGTTIVLNGITS